MNIWAIADLHLAHSVPEKTMEVFGSAWTEYMPKLKAEWTRLVQPDDLVLIAGDITWAMRGEDARIDLEWIDSLPGKKVISKGNHDYWWPSNAKLKELLPPSLSFVNGNAITIGDIALCGTRLWDVPGLSFTDIIEYKENPRAREQKEDDMKIYKREFLRLERALEMLDPHAKLRIAMIHYPPTTPDLVNTEVTDLLESHKIDICVFGHLHNVVPGKGSFGLKGSTRYIFTAADYLGFTPLKIYPS